MCAARVCSLQFAYRDALEARLEEYKEGRAPCDLCSRLNWRCLLQSGQTLPTWPQWTAQRERRGKYVRSALRSLNSVLAMPSRHSTKPNPGQFSQIKLAGRRRAPHRSKRPVTEEGWHTLLTARGFHSRGDFCSRGLHPLGSTICKLRDPKKKRTRVTASRRGSARCTTPGRRRSRRAPRTRGKTRASGGTTILFHQAGRPPLISL